MVLYNEQLQLIPDPGAFKEKLKLEYDEEPDSTQEELELALGEAYSQMLNVDAAKNFYSVSLTAAAPAASPQLFGMIGHNIFERIRGAVCSVINALSTVDEIIEAIVSAIAAILPGGGIIAWLVKRVIKFFLGKGFAWLCPVAA
jgi:hypothetical protein